MKGQGGNQGNLVIRANMWLFVSISLNCGCHMKTGHRGITCSISTCTLKSIKIDYPEDSINNPVTAARSQSTVKWLRIASAETISRSRKVREYARNDVESELPAVSTQRLNMRRVPNKYPKKTQRYRTGALQVRLYLMLVLLRNFGIENAYPSPLR
jgi:hypothetical protein